MTKKPRYDRFTDWSRDNITITPPLPAPAESKPEGSGERGATIRERKFREPPKKRKRRTS